MCNAARNKHLISLLATSKIMHCYAIHSDLLEFVSWNVDG